MVHMMRGRLEVLLVDAHGITHTNFIGDHKKDKLFSYVCISNKISYVELNDFF